MHNSNCMQYALRCWHHVLHIMSGYVSITYVLCVIIKFNQGLKIFKSYEFLCLGLLRSAPYIVIYMNLHKKWNESN